MMDWWNKSLVFLDTLWLLDWTHVQTIMYISIIILKSSTYIQATDWDSSGLFNSTKTIINANIKPTNVIFEDLPLNTAQQIQY